MNVSQRLAELTRPTGEEDLLAVSYQKPRVAVPPKQAAAAVGAVLLLVAGWFVLRDDEPEIEAPPDLPPANVVVSVVGAVAEPGLVTLDEGSRVADALEQAQPLPEAELLSLNPPSSSPTASRSSFLHMAMLLPLKKPVQGFL